VDETRAAFAQGDQPALLFLTAALLYPAFLNSLNRGAANGFLSGTLAFQFWPCLMAGMAVALGRG
jgi:hypothetical protein